jgi:hypothetical protein
MDADAPQLPHLRHRLEVAERLHARAEERQISGVLASQ